MQLRDWVNDKFGGVDEETLLDESMYSNEELRKDISKLEYRLRDLENEMEEHDKTYGQLLRAGADVSELQRKKYAQKAKWEKKKYHIKKKQYRATSLKYGTVLSIQGMRQLTALQDQDDLTLDEVMDTADAQEIKSEIIERLAAFNVEMEDIQEIQDAIDVEIMEDELLVEDVSKEEQIMEQLAAAEMSEQHIDIESETDTGVSDIDMAEFEEEMELEPDIES